MLIAYLKVQDGISQNHFVFLNIDTEVLFSGTKFIAWMQKHWGNVQRMP